MTAINFPDSPSVNDEHVASGRTWIWDGTTWNSKPYVDDVATIVTAAVVGTAPETLDTLNEIAAAIGDDASFSTTVNSAISTKAPITPNVNAKAANYTLSAGDRGGVVTCDGTFTVTIPSGTFSSGDRVDFVNTGTGVITFAGSGVTINSVDSAVTIDTQWAAATFFFTSSTTGVLVGKIA